MQALDLDPSLAEAYSVLGEIHDTYDWDFSAAEQAHMQALELNPNSSQVHTRYSIHLMVVGRLDEAIAEIKSAIELEPTSLLNNRLLGDALYWSRRYDEAIAQLKRVVAMDASFGSAYIWLWQSYEMKGDYDQAFEWFYALHKQEGTSASELRAIKKAYATLGWRGILQREIEEYKQAEKKGVTYYSDIARVYAQLGDREQAFVYLEKGFKNREDWTVTILIDPELDPLRSDPRFADIVRRVGLAQ